MTPTSEERRDVAKKIREYVDAYGDKIDDAEMVLLGTVWCRGEFNEVVRPTSEAELLAMVADLIDPTCEMDDAGDVPASVKDNLNTFFCSECGSPVYNDMSPSYCPYCGARVVSDDG